MPNNEITTLVELTTPADESLLAIVDDPSGLPITKKITRLNLMPKVTTAFLQFITGSQGRISLDINPTTIAHLGMVYLPYAITVNKLTIRSGGNVTVAGTLDIGLYTSDGQTKVIDVTTASIVSTYSYYTTNVSAVTLAPGLYYIVVVPNSTANVSVMVWRAATDDDTFAVTSKSVIQGTLAVTASTLPVTFDPTSITSIAHRAVIVRLDN